MTEKQAAPKKHSRRWTGSKLIALGILFVDGTSTYMVLYLCRLAILTQYLGSLPYLTTMITALQTATGYVLGHYFMKSKAENTKGGITYDAAASNNFQENDL